MTSDVDPKTILLRGDPLGSEGVAIASEALTPGQLAEIAPTGIQKHSVAGGSGAAHFVREESYVGGSIDDAYADGDTVPYWSCRKGDWIYAWLADTENVAKGALLESDGSGAFQALDSAAAARATLTVGAADAAVKFDANESGLAGNDIQIQYLAGTAATATVAVTGNLIQIKPNTTTPGTTDQANDIVTLVNGDPAASALVNASAPGAGTDAVVTPVAATNLAGGAETLGNALVQALEAVNNTSGGAPARIRVEVL